MGIVFINGGIERSFIAIFQERVCFQLDFSKALFRSVKWRNYFKDRKISRWLSAGRLALGSQAPFYFFTSFSTGPDTILLKVFSGNSHLKKKAVLAWAVAG